MLDSGDTIFFKRELERIKAELYMVEYQELMARQLFPVDNTGGLGIKSTTIRVFDKVGMAKIIASYAADLPRADISAREINCPVVPIGTSFGFTVEEIAAARHVNRPLDSMKGDAARRAFEEKLNDIAFGIDSEGTAAGLTGLLSNTNIPTANVVNGASGFPDWDNKTPDEILFDVNDMFADMRTTTLNKERPNTLLLPIKQWNRITATPRSANSDTTILAYLVRNSPYLASEDDVISVPELGGAGTGGVDIMIAYDRNPRKLVQDVPWELQFLPVQERGLEFVTPAIGKLGGLNFYYPLSASIREGI